MLELRTMYRGVAVHATADEEHHAALELLVLVMLADDRITVDEQEAIEQINEELEWSSPSFSFATALGAATSRVRAARLEPDGVARLLEQIDARIASRVLRSALLAICREVADADRQRSAEEQRLLDSITERFA